jgi:uncharacterized membrane protein YcaP (DUF421 family)
MEFLRVLLTALFSIIVLFFLTKLIGYRQVNELSMFDYINGISIGSIAAELATAEGKEVWYCTIALVVYGVAAWGLSELTDHSIMLRRKIAGKPVILMQNGKLYDQCFSQVKLDLNEFLMQLRNNGYFDLSQLDTVVFEPNGKLSVLPKSLHRPATPEDLNAAPAQEQLPAEVILDGKVMPKNLSAIGYDEVWLKNQLKGQNLKVSEVFLGLCMPDGTLSLFQRYGKKDCNILE